MAIVVLNVPYMEKDQARLLGARWEKNLKTWYVPEGMLVEPFECWLPDGGVSGEHRPKIKPRISKVLAVIGQSDKSSSGPAIAGSGYVELAHDCNPFEVCEVCKPILDASGWNSRQIEVRKAAAACVL